MSNSDDFPDDFVDTQLIEIPTGGEATSSPGSVESLLMNESVVGTSLVKVSAMEQFLASTVQDSKFADFAREILMILVQTVRCEAGSILELDSANQCLFFRAVSGQSSDKLADVKIPVGQGIVGYVAESRLPLIVDNTGKNSHHLKSIDKAVGFETRNLVAVPLIIRGKVFGVLELINRIGEASFTPADVELLTYLCEKASKFFEIRLMIAWVKHKTDSSRGV